MGAGGAGRIPNHKLSDSLTVGLSAANQQRNSPQGCDGLRLGVDLAPHFVGQPATLCDANKAILRSKLRLQPNFSRIYCPAGVTRQSLAYRVEMMCRP
jgi:hypothetical protein